METRDSEKELRSIIITRRFILTFFVLETSFLIARKTINVSWIFIASLVLWLFISFPFEYFLKRAEDEKSRDNINFSYFLFECLILTVCIHYMGGITWWGGIFYSASMVFAYFMLPLKKATYLTLITVFVFFNGLAVLEFSGFIPYSSIFFKTPTADFIYFIATLLMTDFSLIFLAGVLSVFSRVLSNKRKGLELVADKADEEKIVLEVNVGARTKETRDLANDLEVQVEKRTEDLNQKIKEMKNFNKLTKGREDKLIELEKEAEKLKAILKNKSRNK